MILAPVPVPRWFRSLCLGARVLGLALVLGSGFVASVARADDSAPGRAVEHYNRGRAHYQAGRYREALEELDKALALDPNSPNLVYNVARIHELLGEVDVAIGYYERYARMLPPNEREERERVQATLQRLRGAKQHAPVVTPARSAPPPEMKRGVADPAFWVTLSTAAAAFAAGGVTGALAMDASEDAKAFVVGKDGDVSERNDVVQRSERLALASDVLFLGGATFAVTSVLLYVLREKPVEPESPETTGISFGATRDGVFVALRGSL